MRVRIGFYCCNKKSGSQGVRSLGVRMISDCIISTLLIKKCHHRVKLCRAASGAMRA
jgi:hypothetical protein